MATPDIKPRKSPDIKWKQVGRAGILLDLQSGDYFELDEVALSIWKMLDGKTSLAQLSSKLARTYAASGKTVEKDILRFISELRKRKLIDTGES